MFALPVAVGTRSVGRWAGLHHDRDLRGPDCDGGVPESEDRRMEACGGDAALRPWPCPGTKPTTFMLYDKKYINDACVDLQVRF